MRRRSQDETVISFYSHKGGVGKTRLIYELSYLITQLGYTVLMIDADPQASLTSIVMKDELESEEFENNNKYTNIHKCFSALVQDDNNRDLLKIPDDEELKKEVKSKGRHLYKPSYVSNGKLYFLPGDIGVHILHPPASSGQRLPGNLH